MNEDIKEEINYFVKGTQFNKVIKEDTDKKSELKIENKIDNNFNLEIYQRDISSSKIIGYVKEQD